MTNPTPFEVKGFFDPDTFTVSYLVFDPETKDTVLIDPVLDYDPKASNTSTGSAQEIANYIDQHGLKLHYVLESHAHADHLSGSQLFAKKYGAKVGIGADITKVQALFKDVFGLPETFRTDGSQFDFLLAGGDTLDVGKMRFEVIHTPGHTPACVTYRIGDAIFTGDLLFMHDYGTGRCDFPAGSSEAMYDSIQKIYALPDETRVFVGHDYMPNGREPQWETTIGQSKRENPQIKAETTKEAFVTFRDERDKTLAAPRLLFQSVQVNIDAGYLPHQRDGGKNRFLKIPVNMFRGANQTGIDTLEGVQFEEQDV